VSPNLTQEYIVEVTNTCGFTIVDTIKVVDSPLSLIDLTMSLDVTKSCLKDSVEIYVVASGGGGIFTYSWNPSGSTDSSFYVNPIISTIYVVEVTDICGVVEKDSLKITVPQFESLVANVFNIDDTICVSDLVVLTGCATGGVGAYFTWNEGLGSVSPVSVNPTETTTYVLTAQDICGAMEIDSVTISTDLVHLHLPDSIALTCFDETVILDPTITGGNGNETYFWDAGATTSTLSVAPTKTTVYAVTVQTDDGCPSIVDTVKVIVPTFMPMEVSVNKDLTIPCPGDPLPLVAVIKGGSDHSHVQIWSDGENVFNGNNNIVRPLVDTEYTLLCIDICAKDSASANFTVKMPNYDPLVVVVFSADTLICIGSYADLAIRVSGGDGNYAYSWSNGYTTPSIQVFPKFNTTYDVVATDGCKTQVDTSVDVTVSAPVANFSFEYVSPIEIQFNNLSYNNIVAYTWTFDNATSIEEDHLHSFDKSGIHNVWLVVEDENTCVDSIMRIVRPLFFIYSPNAFSSNGDRLNEEFKFKGDGVKSFQLYIYNSWGELLFKTDNIHNGWDGTYNGKKVSAGVYLYKVRAESYQQDIVEEVGKLTLIK
jgi:gliding motility-associated-like protein